MEGVGNERDLDAELSLSYRPPVQGNIYQGKSLIFGLVETKLCKKIPILPLGEGHRNQNEHVQYDRENKKEVDARSDQK